MTAEALMTGVVFGLIGPTEIVIILVIALLVFGPDKLPEIGRQLGSVYRELNRMRSDMTRALDLDEYNRYDMPSYGPPQGTTYASAETHAIESYQGYAAEDMPETTEPVTHVVAESTELGHHDHDTHVATDTPGEPAEKIVAMESSAHPAQEAKEQ
jgi:sec-independent protein translocase protein TatA